MDTHQIPAIRGFVARRFAARRFAALSLIALLCTSSGCAQTAMLRDHAAFNGQTAMNAISPIFDPAGGSVSNRGREIERNLSR